MSTMTIQEGVIQRWGMLKLILEESCPHQASSLDWVTPGVICSYIRANSTGDVKNDSKLTCDYLQNMGNIPESFMKDVRKIVRQLIFLLIE